MHKNVIGIILGVGDFEFSTKCYLFLLYSASMEKIKVHPNLYVLTIQLLVRNERYAELGLFVMNKASLSKIFCVLLQNIKMLSTIFIVEGNLFLLQILEPSKEVALQLLESGRQSIQTRKLGLDMLRQLSLHHDYVLMLAQDGHYNEALRYARKHKVILTEPIQWKYNIYVVYQNFQIDLQNYG